MKARLVSVLLSLLLSVVSSQVAADDKPTVVVSILPQKFIVQQISGDTLNVQVMVAPGASPATYEPKPSQMRKLSESAVYLAIGVPFESAWLDKISGVNPRMKIAHTDAGIEKLAMAEHSHEEDEHDEHPGEDHEADNKLHEDEHDGDGHHEDEHETGLDPHIWLSPSLVKKQAEITADVLAGLFPDNREFFMNNLEDFLARIDTLNTQLREVLNERQGTEFMVFHPSWGYFAQEYGLHQVAIEIEGKNPKPAQLKELIEHARENDIRVIFAQPQFSAKSAEVIAREIGGEVIMIDPLAENWLQNMQDVAGTFSRVLKKG